MIDHKQAKREAKQLFRLCGVGSVLDAGRVRQVVDQTIANGRRNSRAVLTHFVRLLRLYQNQHTAMVETATPLSAELHTLTEADLRRVYGQDLTIVFSDRPALIAGMRIQIGSDVYDGSVKAGLAALEKCF